MHPFQIFLNLYLFIFVMVTAYFGLYAALRGDTRAVRIFTVFCALSGIYLFGYLMELNSITLEQMRFWNGVQYVGLSFIPALWVLLAMLLARPEQRFSRVFLAALWGIPCLTFLARSTDGLHHLFYARMWVNADWVFPVLFLEKGPFYLMNAIYVTACTLAGSYFFLMAYYGSIRQGGRLPGMFVLSTLMPWIGLLLNVINLGGVGLDYIALISPITLALIGVILSNRNFMRLRPLARDNVFDTVSEGMVVLDGNNRLADFNPAATRIFPELKTHAVGMDLRQLLGRSPEMLEAAERGAEAEVRKNGRTYRVTVTEVANELHQPMGRILSLSDISEKTETIRILQENQARIEHLSFRDQLTDLYNRRYYEMLLDRELQSPRLPTALILADLNGLKLVNDAFGHPAGDQLLKDAAHLLRRFTDARGTIARIGGDEFALLLPEAGADAAEELIRRFRERMVIESDALLSVSMAFGYGIREKRQERMEDVQKRAEEMMYRDKLVSSPVAKRKVLEGIIGKLKALGEWESAHSEGTGDLCSRMAKAYGLPEEAAVRMRTLGALHDVGKIGIEATLLNKPSAVTEEELDEIRRHPEIGYHILTSVGDLADLAPFVLYHHERWDGGGFPLGLARERIPMESRLLAVADVFETLRRGTPYRPALGEAEALEEIRRHAGTQFDPEWVRVLERVCGARG